MGRTSEPQAGQWYTRSGSIRISGCPHSQAWIPKASGKAAICSRVPKIAPSTERPQESQQASSGPRGNSSPDPHAGQRMWRGPDVVRDGAFIAGRLVGCQHFAGTYLYGTVPTRAVL